MQSALTVIALLAVMLVALLSGSPAYATDRFSVSPRGAEVELTGDVPAGAKAIVLILEGGGGNLDASGRGFAFELYRHLPDQAVGAVLMDAPSDQHGFMDGMSPKFRASPAHMKDIAAAIMAVRTRYRRPVWLFGISLGSRSAAMFSVRQPNLIGGLILASSSTNPPRGKSIEQLPLHRVNRPILALAHSDDRCAGTPPEGAARIVARATFAPRRKAVMLDGGHASGRQDCGVGTPHVFSGIEEQVATVIADFVLRP